MTSPKTPGTSQLKDLASLITHQLEHMQAKHGELQTNINNSRGWRDINMSYSFNNVLTYFISSSFVSVNCVPIVSFYFYYLSRVQLFSQMI